MKNLLFVLLLLPSLAYSQEAWLDEVVDDTPVETINPLESRIESLEASIDAIAKAIDGIAPKMAMPATCECKCDCPSLDEIRQVVREELERVTITVKSVEGVEKKVEVPLTKASRPKVMQLQPGETVIAIDGQPVTPFTYQSQTYNAPITQYTTPRYEMRVMNNGGFFGAVRSRSQCANGNCN